MLRTLLYAGLALFAGPTIADKGAAVMLTVPGFANPWLAAMPDGTKMRGDVAPKHAPIRVEALFIPDISGLTFSAEGRVSHGGQTSGPDGGSLFSHASGAINGISNIRVPINALLGVFLAKTHDPEATPPDALSFATQEARDYTEIAPQLGQIFFIGDGKTAGGADQLVIVPKGAADLYLGTMDGWGWYNNSGAFEVTITTSAE